MARKMAAASRVGSFKTYNNSSYVVEAASTPRRQNNLFDTMKVQSQDQNSCPNDSRPGSALESVSSNSDRVRAFEEEDERPSPLLSQALSTQTKTISKSIEVIKSPPRAKPPPIASIPARTWETEVKEMLFIDRVEAVQRCPPKTLDLIRCYVTRHSQGIFGGFPSFELRLERGGDFVLAARRRKKCTKGSYLIATDQQDVKRESENCLSKMKSADLMGHEHSLVHKDGVEVLRIHNEGDGKGPRAMRVELFMDGIALKSKEPETVGKDLFMEFDGGRVKKASVKNFALAVAGSENGETVLQFGKIKEEVFCLDFRAPLTLEMAFAIALSAIDRKLMYTI